MVSKRILNLGDGSMGKVPHRFGADYFGASQESDSRFDIFLARPNLASSYFHWEAHIIHCIDVQTDFCRMESPGSFRLCQELVASASSHIHRGPAPKHRGLVRNATIGIAPERVPFAGTNPSR
jgi:hypothetical protein